MVDNNEPNIIIGTDLDDTLVGTGGIDGIDGGNGDDKVFGLNGADDLFGGRGNDELFGGSGDDRLHGGPLGANPIRDGFDILHGGIGNDELVADGGSGELHGDSGDDTLRAIEQGEYSFSGGSGSDHFALELGGTVSIEDFSLGDGDRITVLDLFGTGVAISNDETAVYVRANEGSVSNEVVATIYASPDEMDAIIKHIEDNVIVDDAIVDDLIA